MPEPGRRTDLKTTPQGSVRRLSRVRPSSGTHPHAGPHRHRSGGSPQRPILTAGSRTRAERHDGGRRMALRLLRDDGGAELWPHAAASHASQGSRVLRVKLPPPTRWCRQLCRQRVQAWRGVCSRSCSRWLCSMPAGGSSPRADHETGSATRSKAIACAVERRIPEPWDGPRIMAVSSDS